MEKPDKSNVQVSDREAVSHILRTDYSIFILYSDF